MEGARWGPLLSLDPKKEEKNLLCLVFLTVALKL